MTKLKVTIEVELESIDEDGIDEPNEMRVAEALGTLVADYGYMPLDVDGQGYEFGTVIIQGVQ